MKLPLSVKVIQTIAAHKTEERKNKIVAKEPEDLTKAAFKRIAEFWDSSLPKIAKVVDEMTEIPEHLMKRAQAARDKAASEEINDRATINESTGFNEIPNSTKLNSINKLADAATAYVAADAAYQTDEDRYRLGNTAHVQLLHEKVVAAEKALTKIVLEHFVKTLK